MPSTDSYVKYAHNLSREMNTLGLHAEAANALLLHANLHDWSNTQLNELELGGMSYCAACFRFILAQLSLS